MLIYHKIEMENFGVYRGKQNFELPKYDGQAGISIVYALNGKGKTTLLNAFKFAFTGEVKDKKLDRILKMKEIFNKHAVDENDSKGGVKLYFQHNDDEYILTRSFNKTSDLLQGKFFLEKNGDFLNDDEKESTINQIMPKQLVKFFLFDAAMLQEYASLISNSDRSLEIRSAIDDALGLPYFQQSINSLRNVKDFFLKEKAKLVKKDGKNIKILKEISGLNESKGEKKNALIDLNGELFDIQSRISELKSDVENNEDEKKLVDNLIILEGNKSSTKVNIGDLKEKINQSLKIQWYTCLVSDMREKRNQLVSNNFVKNFNPELFNFLEQSIKDEKCLLCEGEIKGSHKEHLEKLRKSSEHVHKPLKKISNLLDDEKYFTDLLKLEGKYNELITSLNNIKNEIKDLKDQGVKGDSKVSEVFILFENLLGEEKSYLGQIQTINDNISIIENNITTLSNNLNTEEDDDEMNRVEKKIDLSEYLLSILVPSLEYHRTAKRKNIETSASAWFKKATHLGYAGLKIKNNYGMVLLHENGSEMVIKSDGTEHIVSLALIQALYRNSPVSGPLMIDSPMGQLDPEHKKNMLQELPEINKQIVLLVHEGELNRNEAKNTFRSLLKKEYIIESVDNDPYQSIISVA